MGERESKVIYRTRTVPEDEERRRPQIPTALDSADYPDAASFIERVKSRHDREDDRESESSSVRTARPKSTTTKVYPVQGDNEKSIAFVSKSSDRPPPRDQPPRSDAEGYASGSRRNVVVDQRPSRDAVSARASATNYDTRSSGDRAYIDVEVDRPRHRAREFLIDDSVRRDESGPYIIDTTGTDVIDVSVPRRQSERDYDNRSSRYAYDDTRSTRTKSYQRDEDTRPRRPKTYDREVDTTLRRTKTYERDDDTGLRRTKTYERDDENGLRRTKTYERESGEASSFSKPNDSSLDETIVLVRRNVTPPRSQASRRYNDDNYTSVSRAAPPPTARDHEVERERDWNLVESMRDTRINSAQPRDPYYDDIPPEAPVPPPIAPTAAPTRARAPTQSSEDSYVMVPPSQAGTRAPSIAETRQPRSAFSRSDYSGPELRRRRSRSISFREGQVKDHDCSERRHLVPGAEADVAGRYLRQNSPPPDDPYAMDRYSSSREDDRYVDETRSSRYVDDTRTSRYADDDTKNNRYADDDTRSRRYADDDARTNRYADDDISRISRYADDDNPRSSRYVDDDIKIERRSDGRKSSRYVDESRSDRYADDSRSNRYADDARSDRYVDDPPPPPPPSTSRYADDVRSERYEDDTRSRMSASRRDDRYSHVSRDSYRETDIDRDDRYSRTSAYPSRVDDAPPSKRERPRRRQRDDREDDDSYYDTKKVYKESKYY